nr:polysaccharide biosynthesis tyrosine autokinase [Costertonia aggregata]
MRYDVPLYSAQASIKITNKGSSELNVFKDLEVLSGDSGDPIEDEVLSFKSRSNLIEVAKRLQLNVKVLAIGDIKNSEIYGDLPFKINFIESDSVIRNANFDFYIQPKTNTTFAFSLQKDSPSKKFDFGEDISTKIGDIIITPNFKDISNFRNKEFKVEVRPINTVAQYYQRSISIAPEQKGASVLNIYLYDPVLKKAQDIINELIKVYNENEINDKRNIANRTSQFIEDRISNIYSDLSSVDQNAEEFKSNRGLTDISSQASLNLNSGALSEQELQNTQIQLQIASSMKDIVENSDGFEVLPSNIGLSDQSIATTTARYNELALERKKLLESSNDKNPIIVNIDEQLSNLKQNMQSSLGSMTNNLNLQANSLSKRLSTINSRLYSAPKNERKLRDITRKQETTEALYLYLLQKREEAQIAFASSEPNFKVIDWAYSLSSSPIGPNKRIMYLAAIFVGLLIPFMILYVRDLLDTKIHNKRDLEKIVDIIPVLGELPKLGRKEKKLIHTQDRSILAESLRILRTNLDYLLKTNSSSENGNVIFVTSSVSGEGKTFVSSNLTMTLASTDKKVLLIGADIRNPKLYTFFSGKDVDKLGTKIRDNKDGLSEYLFNDDLGIKDVINPILAHDTTIDVIYSGKIPPNPAELLMSDRFEELFKDVSKKYDYIVVDTAPMLVVTDTLLISKYADQILYITKAGMTEKKVLEYPLKLKNDKKIKNLSFVVNNVKQLDLGYGGKYGYGYGKTLKKWWKFT